MESGPARDSVLKTYPSAVAWQVEGDDRPYRPDGLAVLGCLIFGIGVGLAATAMELIAGIVLLILGALLIASRKAPACQRDPIFRTGRDGYVRLSSRRDIAKIGRSQSLALATGPGICGFLVLVAFPGQPAWAIGMFVAALAMGLFTMLVFKRIAENAA